MASKLHQLVRVVEIGAILSAGTRRVVFRGSMLALLVICSATQAAISDQEATEGAPEESVLVATRDAAATESTAQGDSAVASEPGQLEPIAQTSDHAPELAGATCEPATIQVASTEAEATDREESARGETIESSEPDADQQAAAPANESSSKLEDLGPSGLEPVKFQGILVGDSTRQQLLSQWGEPDEQVTTPEGDVLVYQIHPFDAVEVLVAEEGVVTAIKVALSSPLEPSQLAKQLSLDHLRSATVSNDEDQPLGQAYPERGVLFMFDAADSDSLAGDGKSSIAVSHVVVQPIAAQAFVMRAESNIDGPYTENIDDLKTAISIDPNFAHAHFLLAKIYLATGQADLAGAEAAKACELEPSTAAYQLCRSQAQELLGEYDASVLTARAVLDDESISQIDKAQALFQMARLASLGDKEIASKAIAFHSRSIENDDKLATSSNGPERRAAKRLLVEAHMAMAEEIARQPFNDKIESLSQWIGRASGLAEEYIEHDGGSVELRLLIAQRALGALATFRPTLDPTPWVGEAEQAASKLLQQSDDELWQARIQWELGIAYCNALRVEHVRRETASALKYGQLAVDYLAQGANSRQAVHSSEQLAGQLYFQMGAVYAVHQLNHKKAVEWYDKADVLLTGQRPVSELYSPRREGEMLVSMGVTYWQLGEQARALQLTQSGVNLVEMAVEDGVIARTALAVPYGNLATMYKDTGESTSAAKYAELAKSVSEPASGARATARRTSMTVPEPQARQASAQRPQGTAVR